ncbi:ABC transporter substrate-binding protein [Nocardioides donggukensis]|uniref:ABC transporter substrate-binding protein n=1 Tax=Nocardioides donggukensis TaxID=2774019 RepID=UPI00191EFF99|nr:ABC transporter substrate-binding protein [Nocardioides donggukensis]
MFRPNKIAKLGVAAMAASMVLASCGSDDDGGSSTGGGGGGDDASGVQLYFVDGNTADYSADFDPGTLEGVRATYPGPEIADDFRDRLLGVDPKLKDFTYGQESYDAVMVTALAAVAAKNDSGKAIAKEIPGVTKDGEQCTDFKSCSDLLADGQDIDYDGPSGPLSLNETGSPAEATIGIYQYGDDNTYSAEDYIEEEIPPAEGVKPNQLVSGKVPKGDGVLTIGTLLPQSGDLAFLGPPEFAGVDLAVQEINEAGGVLGKPVKQVKADSGDGTPNIAPSETDKLLRGGADAIIGAASSSVSLSVIDRITGAGVVHFSPANTSTAFDTYADNGLYFRTAPSDVMQGSVMANLVLGDGYDNVALLVRQDSYGEALAENVTKFFEESGGTVVSTQLYDPNAASYSAEVSEIAGQDPDAVVLIAFDETKKIVPELIEAGLGQK